jgi:uncharacterized protein YbaP (TraB family)
VRRSGLTTFILAMYAALGATLAPAEEAVPFGHGLLWQVEASEVPASYVFGTIHRAGDSAPAIPDAALDALGRSKTAGFEVLITPDLLPTLLAAMALPDGQRLEDVAGPQLFERALEAARPYKIDRAALQHLKPWAVATTLLTPPPKPGRPPPELMDAKLQKRARALGLDLFGLETAEEQIDLFDTMKTDRQVALLRQAVDAHSELEAEMARLAAAYKAHDVGAIYRDYLEELQGLDANERQFFENRLLRDRNRGMADHMVPRLEAGGTFVAVGALHLPGPDGVLSLLAERGFTVTAIE